MQELRDEEVMLSYQKGNARAMDELLRRYKHSVYRFACRLTGGREHEAQDIAQETFLAVHASRDRYRPDGKFSTWIFGIAHNAAVSRMRKNRRFILWPRKDDSPDELRDFAGGGPSPRDSAAGDDLASCVKRCVGSLPLLQREALILREYEQLDYGEISQILNISLGTTKTLIHRARLNLKEKLKPYVNEPAGGPHA